MRLGHRGPVRPSPITVSDTHICSWPQSRQTRSTTTTSLIIHFDDGKTRAQAIGKHNLTDATKEKKRKEVCVCVCVCETQRERERGKVQLGCYDQTLLQTCRQRHYLCKDLIWAVKRTNTDHFDVTIDVNPACV